MRKRPISDAHKWEFKPRFRRHAFGWKSQPAITRIKQGVAEIKKVAKKDPALAAEGAVSFLERVSPALEHVDGSSGSIGAAVGHAIAELVPLIANAPADAKKRDSWLERLFEAHQVDEIPYIERLSDHWGELCASKEIASTWADRLVGLTRMALSPDKSFRGHFHGTSACLSALYRAERFDELIDLLRVDTIWPYKRWAVRALAAKGQKAEAIRYAESSRSPWASDLEVDSVCEEILLSSGLIDEAYRYGARANRGGTYLATFRAVSKKYPHKPAGEILADLVKTTPGDEGKWFAAAKDVGLYDDALALASRTPCDRWSRSARRRPARRRGVRARHGPGRRSCLRTPTQTQEVRSTMSRPDPIQYADRLYTAIRAANFSPISFLAFGNAVKDGVDFRRMPRMAAEPFMRVVGEMLDLEEEAAQAGEIVDAEVTLGVSAPASTGSASPIPPSPAEEMTPASATTISKPELPASSLPSRRPRDRR